MSQITKYGWQFSENLHPLEVERFCIRKGGAWKRSNGTSAGEGLFFHFKEFIKICWPEFMQHRWFDLVLKNYLEHEWIGIAGPKDACVAGHTRILNPLTGEEPTILELYETQTFPIVLTQYGPALAGIPFIKGRECLFKISLSNGDDFTATGHHRVLTPSGFVTVSSLSCGDILSGFEPCRTHSNSEPDQKARASNARNSTGTTGDSRCDCPTCSCLCDEPLRLSSKISQGVFPSQVDVQERVTGDAWWRKDGSGSGQKCSLSRESCRLSNFRFRDPTSTAEMALLHRSFSKILERVFGLYRLNGQSLQEISQIFASQESGPYSSRRPQFYDSTPLFFSSRFPCNDIKAQPTRVQSIKRVGEDFFFDLSVPYFEHYFAEGAFHHNSKTGSLTVILLTDYYAFPSQTSIILSSTTMKALKNRVFGEFTMRHRAARNRFSWLPGHMIESECRIVTDERDECVNGRDVRNGVIGIPVKDGGRNALDDIVGIKNKRKRWMIDELQTLPASALDGTANFMQNNADCKVIGPGNPSDMMDAHGKLCQPHSDIGGWDDNIDQQGGTKVWRTTFDNGVCIQLPGSDSPNMDIGPNDPVPFPFLMTRERMEKDARTWGKTDWHFQMFNEGRWPRGQGASRVITRQMCINGHAMDEPMWAGPTRTKILCMDAGFGGDRCVAHELHFGYEAWRAPHPGAMNSDGIISQTPPTNDGRQIIALIKTDIVPITGSDVKGAEDQIVLWSKRICEIRNIPYENFFYEPGMRTSLVQKMTQLWSHKPIAIDFGGKPSENMVSSEIRTTCRDYYFNFVTELWYSVRLIIECEQFRRLDEDTMREGCMREYKRVGGNKIQVETKADFKEKAGFSPDKFDALVTGIEGAKRRGFVIRRLNAPQAEEQDQQWKLDMLKKARSFHEAGQLTFS